MMALWKGMNIRRSLEMVNRQLFHHLKTNGAFIAGGYAAWCASPRDDRPMPRDVDVWLKDEDQYEPLCNWLRGEGFELVKMIGDIGTIWKFTKNEDVLKNVKYSMFKGFPLDINVIKPRDEGNLKTFGEPSDVVARFDFTVCRCWLAEPSYVQCDPDFERDEEKKRLVVKSIICPAAAIQRVSKYSQKGYKITLPSVFKILDSWKGIDDYSESDRLKFAQVASDAAEDWNSSEWEEFYASPLGKILGKID